MNDTHERYYVVTCDDCARYESEGDPAIFDGDEECETGAAALFEAHPNMERVPKGTELPPDVESLRAGNCYFRCPGCGQDALGGVAYTTERP